MVRLVRCPSFAKTYFTPNELSGWGDGVDFSFLEKKIKENKSKPTISLLPIVIQNKILVGKPAKLRSL